MIEVIEQIIQNEKEWIHSPRLKFKNVDKIDHKDLSSLLLEIINIVTNTCYTEEVLTKKITDMPGSHRSTKDLFNLVKFYRPETTLLDLYMDLLLLLEDKKIGNLYCKNIHFHTWYRLSGRYYSNSINSLKDHEKCDEFVEMSKLIKYYYEKEIELV